ncbi:MAG: hypothetical protein U0821_23940 [Chloroflexota bacterium]
MARRSFLFNLVTVVSTANLVVVLFALSGLLPPAVQSAALAFSTAAVALGFASYLVQWWVYPWPRFKLSLTGSIVWFRVLRWDEIVILFLATASAQPGFRPRISELFSMPGLYDPERVTWSTAFAISYFAHLCHLRVRELSEFSQRRPVLASPSQVK